MFETRRAVAKRSDTSEDSGEKLFATGELDRHTIGRHAVLDETEIAAMLQDPKAQALKLAELDQCTKDIQRVIKLLKEEQEIKPRKNARLKTSFVDSEYAFPQIASLFGGSCSVLFGVFGLGNYSAVPIIAGAVALTAGTLLSPLVREKFSGLFGIFRSSKKEEAGPEQEASQIMQKIKDAVSEGMISKEEIPATIDGVIEDQEEEISLLKNERDRIQQMREATKEDRLKAVRAAIREHSAQAN